MNCKVEYFCKGVIFTGVLCAVLANLQARNYERVLQEQFEDLNTKTQELLELTQDVTELSEKVLALEAEPK